VIAGVGLGLAICRAIARAHGGSIVAGTRPEGGARFEFTLPIVEPAK
jgi:two-component system sensor histidine kinase KdpD